MERLILDLIEDMVDPIAVVDDDRYIVYSTKKFRELTGFNSEDKFLCTDALIPAFSKGEKLCCWNLLRIYKRRRENGIWLNIHRGESFLCSVQEVKVRNNSRLLLIKLKPIGMSINDRCCSLCSGDFFMNLLRNKGSELYTSFIREYLKRVYKSRNIFWIERDPTDELSSFVFNLASSLRFNFPFDIYWEGKIIHVIPPRKRNGNCRLLGIEGLKLVEVRDLLDIVCAVDAANSENLSPDGETDKVALLGTLTPRELEVLRLVVKGYRNTEIAQELSISLNTVKNHIKNIASKTGINGRVALVKTFLTYFA